jgi:hypothetical protein
MRVLVLARNELAGLFAVASHLRKNNKKKHKKIKNINQNQNIKN